MTIVCPKCMQKAADDQRICPRCGTILLSASQRHELIHKPGENGSQNEGSIPVGSARAASGTSTGRRGSASATTTPVSSADALKEALEYIDSGGNKKPPGSRRKTGEAAAPERRVSRPWAVTIGVTLLAAIGVGAFFGLTGGSGPAPARTDAKTTTTVPQGPLFNFNGAGPSTTGTFTTTSAFNFTYRVTCTAALGSPVTFELLRGGHPVDQVLSTEGSTQEDGTQPGFGTAGTFTIAVKAPTSCDWSLSGST
jgi:hypothetical protein